MGYLCKYLRRAGWRPTVITEHQSEEMFAFLKEDVETVYIRFFKARKPFARKVEWLFVFLTDMLFGCKDRRMYREALRQLKKRPCELILCSTYRTFPLLAARAVARKTRLPFVADLRDIVEQSAGNEFISHSIPKLWGAERRIASAFLRHTKKQRNRALKDASCVTTVSPRHVDVLKAFSTRVELIYNGYDPELFYPAPVAKPCFFITYTGRIVHASQRNPEMLFQAVARLAGDGIISPETFRIRWFTDGKSRRRLLTDAGKHGVMPYMDFFDFVPATQVPGLLNGSAVLLLLSNETDRGVMTTKFFEQLAVAKPVLCIRGDRGCLEEVILRTRAGLAAHEENEVYEFILAHFRRWQLTGETEVDSVREEIEKFSRKAQAAQFIRIFEEISIR